ncbi:hypothetical protein KKA15_07120 [Patescibacteria group bacterium]|nr:hypothetical protein [Patescibacteria group bacterium]
MEGQVLKRCENCGEVGKKSEGKTLGLLGSWCWDCHTQLPSSWLCAGGCNMTRARDDIHEELPNGKFVCQSCYTKNPVITEKGIERFTSGIESLLAGIDPQISMIPKTVTAELVTYRDSLEEAKRPSTVVIIINNFLEYVGKLRTRAKRWKKEAQKAVLALYELLKTVKEALLDQSGPRLIPLLSTR